MKVRWNPKQQRFPKLSGIVMVDTFRGQIRVRKWPRKRGPSKLAKQRRQVAWLIGASKLAKRVWHEQIKLAMIMTKGTGLYPRDLLIHQMSGGMYDVYMEDGRHYLPRAFFRETKMFQGVILELDVMKTFAANVASVVSWPLPVLDTLGFWNVAAPTLITIPEGINVVELHGAISVTPDSGKLLATIFKTALPMAGESTTIGFNIISCQAASGPIPVVAGDTFWLRGVCTLTRTTEPSRRTFLALNVLDAD